MIGSCLVFLDPGLVCEKPEDVGLLRISVPNATELELHYQVIDNLVNSVLKKALGSVVSPQHALERMLERFVVYFPDMEHIGFVESSNNGWICNSIDMSAARLLELRTRQVDIGTVFQIHSLSNWHLPQVELFSGQLFDCAAGSMQDEGIDLVQLDQSLQMLYELTHLSNEANQVDSSGFELFPSNVKKGRAINWAIQELDPDADLDLDKNLLPILKFRSNSLETLDLKPLIKGDCCSLLICGIYTPNLKELNLLTDQVPAGVYTKYDVYRSMSHNKVGWKSANGAPSKRENRTKLELLNDHGLN